MAFRYRGPRGPRGLDGAGGGGGGGSVTQTALGAAPLVVVKDVAGGAVRHRTIKVTGEKSGEMDPAGADGEIHLRPVPPGHFNPCDYGAVADWNGTRTGTIASGSNILTVNDATGLFVGKKIAIRDVTGTKTITAISGTTITLNSAADATSTAQYVVTDNHDAFVACMADMAASGNRAQKMVVNGHFYIGSTLTITATIVVQGSGRQWTVGDLTPGVAGNRSYPGTILVFPANVTGFRIKSTQASEIGGHTSSGERSEIRNLTLFCKDAGTTSGHGIYTTSIVRVADVIIDGFGGDGFRATGELEGDDGNADGCVLDNVQVMHCKGDGYHFEGNDAQVGVIMGCSALANTGAGFYDYTRGNTYVGCHSEANTGYLYDISGFAAVLVGCYQEGSNSRISAGVIVLGGTLAGLVTGGSDGFNIDGNGNAWGAPFTYVNSRGPNYVRTIVGERSNGTAMQAFRWETYEAASNTTLQDSSSLVYLGDATPWWSLQNVSAYREVVRFPTQISHVRRPAMHFVNGYFLGRDDEGSLVHRQATANATPLGHKRDNQPITYEVGDVIENATPSQGSLVERRCLTAGTLDDLAFFSGTGTITNGTPNLVVSSAAGLEVGQYIAIATISGTYKIDAVNGTAVTLHTNVSSGAVAQAVSFVAPVFESFGGDLATSLATTDATVTRIRRVPVADGHVRRLNWILTCRSTDNTGAILGEWEIKASYKRVSGALSTSYAATITNTLAIGGPTGGPTLTLNGSTDVDLNVTGIAATNLTWEVAEFAL